MSKVKSDCSISSFCKMKMKIIVCGWRTNGPNRQSRLCDLTFPLGRPRSFRAWKIPFSVFPDAKVRVMLFYNRRRKKQTVEGENLEKRMQDLGNDSIVPILPSHRNLPIHIGWETHSHPATWEAHIMTVIQHLVLIISHMIIFFLVGKKTN